LIAELQAHVPSKAAQERPVSSDSDRYARDRHAGAASRTRANVGGGLRLLNPEQVVLDEMRHIYRGKVVTAHDLNIF
jgi:hypothetical protein